MYLERLAARLQRAGTHVVACYNYTGTPYVGRDVLPEVVYAYGLQEAISKGYLKKVRLHSYIGVKSESFVEEVIRNFLEQTQGLTPEGMMPKLAFFAAQIEEVTRELRPAVEKALLKRGISPEQILVNVGDDKITRNDDIRDFNRLDTADSNKRFILLVNKGREGWNCRSLFGVAMFREPKSKVFVLQATLRCLRAIGEAQHTGQVYLTDDNKQILEAELQQNFRLSIEQLQQAASDRETVQVHVTKPPRKLTLRRVHTRYDLAEKDFQTGTMLLPERDTAEQWERLIEKYRALHTQQDGLNTTDAARAAPTKTEDITARLQRRQFSALMLVAEIARYLNRDPLEIEDLLASTAEGIEPILEAINQFNDLLYDEVIPRLFGHLYDLNPTEQHTEEEVELIKVPEKGYYEVTARKGMIVHQDDASFQRYQEKSFHLDAYCFDSQPEKTLFWDLLKEGRIQKIYFTGMLTHGQSDFYIQYIDPDSHAVRNYYPDFVVQTDEGGYLLVEVKGDHRLDDPVTKAKADYARQLASASRMDYRVIRGSDADSHQWQGLLE